MKKIIVILLFCLPLYSFCQKVSFGPELGLNIIPIENTDVGYNFQLGYHLGGHLKYHFSEHWKLSSGLYLSQKKELFQSNDTTSIIEKYGSLLSLSGIATGIDLEQIDSIAQSFGANTNILEESKELTTELVIEIPLLANYKYKNFNIYGGPYFSLLLGANKKNEVRTQIPILNVIDINQFDSTGTFSSLLPSADETKTRSNSSTENLSLLDIGFNLGVGYEMNNLHFNLMYSQSFNDYRKDKANYSTQRLNTIRFTVFYLFNLKKNKSLNSAKFE
jgi:hypothetical protein